MTVPVTATLHLTRAVEGITTLNERLVDLFAQAGTAETVAADMKLCLNEAVANIMSYGETGSDEALRIDLRLEASETAARALVEDNCALFDPLASPVAQPMTGLEDAQIGGFGIDLIRSTAREVRWEPLGPIGNRLTLGSGAP